MPLVSSNRARHCEKNKVWHWSQRANLRIGTVKGFLRLLTPMRSALADLLTTKAGFFSSQSWSLSIWALFTYALTVWALPLHASTIRANNLQQEGCFDERRFCFLLSEKDDNSGSFIISVQRFIQLPVALTLYSVDLGPKAHANVFLANNNAIILGETQLPERFWSTMRVKWTVGNIGATHNDEYRYASPLQPQQNYPIVQGVNGKFSHFGASKYALDFGANEGTPVLAARGGIVIDTKSNGTKGGPTPDFAKHANYVAILHDDGTTGEYYHLKYEGVVVKREQRITQGQLLGYTGNTGFSSLPHLHFGVYVAKFHGRYQSVPFSLKSNNF